MKRLGKLGYQLFALLSALVMAPVLGALLLASFLGMLPPWEQIRAALTNDTALAVMKPMDPPSAATTAVRPSGELDPAAADGLVLWNERLRGMSADLSASQAAVRAEKEAIAAARTQLTALATASAELLSQILGRTVTTDEIAGDAARFVLELKQQGERARGLPRLLESLKAVEPEALARIFSEQETAVASDEARDASRRETAELLSAMAPARVAKVLEALGTTRPDLAGQLITRLRNP
ncbi:MAG: hypothetical protein ACKVX7_13965 [Planctomycetota bacterium]